jgi:hypothetical protein
MTFREYFQDWDYESRSWRSKHFDTEVEYEVKEGREVEIWSLNIEQCRILERTVVNS